MLVKAITATGHTQEKSGPCQGINFCPLNIQKEEERFQWEAKAEK